MLWVRRNDGTRKICLKRRRSLPMCEVAEMEGVGLQAGALERKDLVDSHMSAVTIF